MSDPQRGNQVVAAARPPEPALVRATTLDPPWPGARWIRPIGIGVLVILVAALGVAWVQDRNGDYPGHRTPASLRGLKGLIMSPINSEVDRFDRSGPVTAVGPWQWRAAAGPIWTVADGLAHADADGGAIVVDPGRPDVVVQVDVLGPVATAGLVFRWQDAANHFSVEVAPDRSAWLLMRTERGRRTQLAKIVAVTEGSNVGVTLTADRILVAVDGQPRVEEDDRTFAAATAVGLQAPNAVTRFDAFAVLAG